MLKPPIHEITSLANLDKFSKDLISTYADKIKDVIPDLGIDTKGIDPGEIYSIWQQLKAGQYEAAARAAFELAVTATGTAAGIIPGIAAGVLFGLQHLLAEIFLDLGTAPKLDEKFVKEEADYKFKIHVKALNDINFLQKNYYSLNFPVVGLPVNTRVWEPLFHPVPLFIHSLPFKIPDDPTYFRWIYLRTHLIEAFLDAKYSKNLFYKNKNDYQAAAGFIISAVQYEVLKILFKQFFPSEPQPAKWVSDLASLFRYNPKANANQLSFIPLGVYADSVSVGNAQNVKNSLSPYVLICYWKNYFVTLSILNNKKLQDDFVQRQKNLEAAAADYFGIATLAAYAKKADKEKAAKEKAAKEKAAKEKAAKEKAAKEKAAKEKAAKEPPRKKTITKKKEVKEKIKEIVIKETSSIVISQLEKRPVLYAALGLPNEYSL